MANRGEVNREAISAGMEAAADKGEKKDLIRNVDTLVTKLSELKYLKKEQLDTQDGTVDTELEVLNNLVKESIEAMRDADLDTTQTMIKKGYNESAFNTADLHDMGFTDAEIKVLAAKMTK